MIKCAKFGMLAFACVCTTGCATISGNKMQNVVVEAKSKTGVVITDAECTLANDKGRWNTRTPHSATVHKSSKDLCVSCSKQGHETGVTTVASSVNGGMFGNIILGGGIGAIVDHKKGTAYDYPTIIPVEMGKTLNLGKKSKQHIANQANKKNQTQS